METPKGIDRVIIILVVLFFLYLAWQAILRPFWNN